MKKTHVKGHYRTIHGKKVWVNAHNRAIKDEGKNPNLKSYAFSFHFSFPKGYVRKIEAKDYDEAYAIASSECDSVLMDPVNTGYVDYEGEWEEYKEKINQKKAKTMKRKVKTYAENKKQCEEYGWDHYNWDYPYKKNWKFLEESKGEDTE